MAAVLDAFAPYIKKLITDMAEEEVSMLLGVSDEITKLEDNMEGLKAFLADAERRRLMDQSVQRWVRKLKGAMYDATDILDLCQLEADKRRETREGGMEQSNASPGCFRPLFFCLRNPVFAHKIGSRIKELNKRLEGIHKEADKFKFDIGLGSNPESMKQTAAERSTQKMTSEFDESAIVGEKIEKDTMELAQLLTTSGDHDIKVASIVGTGGMGKTTLAQTIFNDATVQEHFKLKIWLSITQHFDEAELLKTAIKHAGGHHDGEQDKTLLVRTLTETLSFGRFLLVLDDVWGDEAWKNALSVPIKKASSKQKGNWVLMTTRQKDLAQRMVASFYQHHVSPLDEEDAWSLLNKQLPPSANQIDGADHLKDVGMEIVRKCGGLPLAVKVMGGLLSRRSKSESEWKAVLNHHAWSVAGLPEELDSRIYLSYEDLSPQLKQCFLYCVLFPKGTTIWQSIIVAMWISEGFVQPQHGSSGHDDRLEEIAADYYQELIMRNLIEPVGGYSTQYQCTMHDVVRSFAEFMSREDSQVVQDSQVASNDGSPVRRMTIGPSNSMPDWSVLQWQVSLRTLVILCKMNFELGASLISFSRLRVLSIHGGDCDGLVGSLYQLRHLRYLCLEGTNISRLPDDIDKMKFLQHIVLGYSGTLGSLPETIIKLMHLRTLVMYGLNDNVVIPKRFGQLTNLRRLHGFPVQVDMDGDGGWCSLEEIGPLSQLRNLTLHGLEKVDASLLAKMTTVISSKEHLNYLELHWTSSGCMGLRDEIEKQQQQRALEQVIEKLQPPSSIRHLHIAGYFGHHLPNWMMVEATWVFKSLRLLKLEDLPCCTQLPDGLRQLPILESLVIESAPSIKSVGPEFQSTGGGPAASFPNLVTLHMEGLSGWEEWDWEGNDDAMAMPALKVLTIIDCKLSSLPPGLARSNRRALIILSLCKLTNLVSVENFPSVVELDVFDCPQLKSISGLSRLHKIRILRCPNLQVLRGVNALDSLGLQDARMETLPGYLQDVNPRFLDLGCSQKLYECLVELQGNSAQQNKIRHIRKRNIYVLDVNDIPSEMKSSS